MRERLKRLWRAWKRVGLAVVALQNRILVGLVFVLGVGPTALWARIVGRRFLDRAPPPEDVPASHWIPLEPRPASMDEAQRPF
ncbi:MAG: hypothetical protein JXB39_05995 [Deltaproteobacteria bacterium]|nr:hypothetical protein [Deltaproteobacteria bacterium]